ncbi:hypothetical protein BJX99DRAFT_265796 [Aspergillus californicus]
MASASSDPNGQSSLPPVDNIQHVVPSTAFTFSCIPPPGVSLSPFSSRVQPTRSPDTPSESSTLTRQTRDHTSFAHQDDTQEHSFSPNLNVSTYRNIYNATPSPQPDPVRESSRPTFPGTNPASPPDLDSVTSGLRNLVVESIETPVLRGEEDGTGDTNSDVDSVEEINDDDRSTYSVREKELLHAPIYDFRLQNTLRKVRTYLADLRVTMSRPELELNAEESIRESNMPSRVKTRAKDHLNQIQTAKRSFKKAERRRRRSTGTQEQRLAVEEAHLGGPYLAIRVYGLSKQILLHSPATPLSVSLKIDRQLEPSGLANIGTWFVYMLTLACASSSD